LRFAEQPRDAATRTAVLTDLRNRGGDGKEKSNGQRPMAFSAKDSPIPLLAAD